MSLKPWLPVPMTPRVIRLLGATLPDNPSADPGTIVGNAKPTADRPAVLRKKSRREWATRAQRRWIHGMSSQWEGGRVELGGRLEPVSRAEKTDPGFRSTSRLNSIAAGRAGNSDRRLSGSVACQMNCCSFGQFKNAADIPLEAIFPSGRPCRDSAGTCGLSGHLTRIYWGIDRSDSNLERTLPR